MAEQPACYGTMFPDLDLLRYNEPCRGQVFVAEVSSHGIGVQGSQIRTDMAAWAKCVACAQYRTCYDLCIAKLALRWAMASL